ncbi:MAG: TrbC/VirB2 family protein [Candidatus Nomurabacteria bacterium]|nr:TrbC/VirB2 family protein [Candidatus Nomurabacteria bacterium]
MTFIKKNWYKFVSLFYVFSMPVVSFAQNSESGTPCDVAGSGKICNPLKSGVVDFPTFLQTLLTGVLRIGIPIVALAIIYCGFLFVSARGNSEKLTKAKDALLYTLIGAAILLGSWAIATMISGTVLAL